MVYLVSATVTLEGVNCVKSLTELPEDIESIDCLVYHSSVDSDVNIAMYLSGLKGKGLKILYINKVFEPLLLVIFSALSADFHDYENALYDKSLLDDLIADYGNYGIPLNNFTEDISVLRKFISTVGGNDSSKRNELIARKVNLALDNITEALTVASNSNQRVVHALSEAKVMLDRLKDQYKQVYNTLLEAQEEVQKLDSHYEEEISSLQSSHLELSQTVKEYETQLSEKDKELAEVKGQLQEAHDKLAPSEEKLREYEARLRELELKLRLEKEAKEEMEKQLRLEQQKNVTSTTFLFPTVMIPVTTPHVMYVEVFSPINYLNTFMIMFQRWLKYEATKRVNSKLLFVYPQLKKYTERYKHLPLLSSSGVATIESVLKESDYYITYEPYKRVLDLFFQQPNVNLYIVVDYLMGDQLLKGSRMTRFGVTRGQGIPDSSIPETHYIRSLTAKSGVIKVMHVNEWYRPGGEPASEAERVNAFMNKHRNMFELIRSHIFGSD